MTPLRPVPRPVPPRACAGFTLVELLVALFALSVLALLSWRGIDAMVRGQSQLQARADQVLGLQVGLAQWTTDLDSLEVLPRLTALDWNGQVLRLVRRSGAGPGAGAQGVSVVAWTRREAGGQGMWLRWQSPAFTRRADIEQAWHQAEGWARNPGEADRPGEVRVMPLDRWSLQYFAVSEWREATPGDPQDTETPPPGRPLPEGVRLVLTPSAGGPWGGPITLDWVNPLASPRRS